MNFEPLSCDFSLASMRSIYLDEEMKSSRYVHEKDYKHFQYVNPKLVLEW